MCIKVQFVAGTCDANLIKIRLCVCFHLADDHNRVKLDTSISITGSDYINASFIVS